MDGFLKRYPEIVRRKAQPIVKSRVQCATKEAFTVFFNLLQTKIETVAITYPTQIISLDKIECSSSVGAIVLAHVGTKFVSQVQGGSGKETFTVVETVAANVQIFPPLVIYMSKNI